MHRDLKLANVLVNFHDVDDKTFFESRIGRFDLQEFKRTSQLVDKVDVFVADLGFAKQLDADNPLTSTSLGTPLYMAPEIFEGKAYSHKVDVWALGVTFYAMLTGNTPFTGTDKRDFKRNLTRGSYNLPKKLKLSTLGLDFLNRCLQHDAELRPTWDELI